MCNGTGSVISRPIRNYEDIPMERPIDSLKSSKVEETKAVSRQFFDLDLIPYTVHAKLNKNEFQVFSRGIIKHLYNADLRRAAASFNYLIGLTTSIDREPERQLYEELVSIKENILDPTFNNQEFNIVHIQTESYQKKISDLTKRFEGIYQKYFINGQHI